ncbi:hypothetical protein AYI70_g582, partial [Smittium culicis]
MTRNSPG